MDAPDSRGGAQPDTRYRLPGHREALRSVDRFGRREVSAVYTRGTTIDSSKGLRALTAAGVIGVSIVVTGLLPVAQAEPQIHTLVLTQQPPILHPVDQHTPGLSVSDAVLYESAITGEHGESGVLTGILVTADVPDAETADLDSDRLGQLSFDLGNGNAIAVIGESIYRGEAVQMTPSAPQLRAVVGGTGNFMGARGQVATTRNEDGTYRHEFTLIND